MMLRAQPAAVDITTGDGRTPLLVLALCEDATDRMATLEVPPRAQATPRPNPHPNPHPDRSFLPKTSNRVSYHKKFLTLMNSTARGLHWATVQDWRAMLLHWSVAITTKYGCLVLLGKSSFPNILFFSQHTACHCLIQ